MFNICYTVEIGERYQLNHVEKIEINENVEQLSDTATITVPGEAWNKALNIEDKVKVGDKVTVFLGYNKEYNKEFTGYIDHISNDNGNIVIECQDELWLFKKGIDFDSAKDKATLQRLVSSLGGSALKLAKEDGCLTAQLSNTTAKAIIEKMVAIVSAITGCQKLNVKSTIDVTYEKFEFDHCTPYDVLKKIQDDAKPDIYVSLGDLNIHPVYSEIKGKCAYSFQQNIEKADLQYVKADDRKVLIKVEVGKKMKKAYPNESFHVGKRGGEVVKLDYKGRGMNKDAILAAAKAELNKYCYDGYEGSITGWLVPICHTAYKASIYDKEYEYKNGDYYVTAVNTSVSSSGGVRQVTLGKRI